MKAFLRERGAEMATAGIFGVIVGTCVHYGLEATAAFAVGPAVYIAGRLGEARGARRELIERHATNVFINTPLSSLSDKELAEGLKRIMRRGGRGGAS